MVGVTVAEDDVGGHMGHNACYGDICNFYQILHIKGRAAQKLGNPGVEQINSLCWLGLLLRRTWGLKLFPIWAKLIGAKKLYLHLYYFDKSFELGWAWIILGLDSYQVTGLIR